MAIVSQCPSCQALFTTPGNSAGKIAKCPNCGHRNKIKGESPEPQSRKKPATRTSPSSTSHTAGSSQPFPYEVFVSHSTHDAKVAGMLVDEIERHGLQCWIAPRNIEAGSTWAGAIVDAIGKCKVFLLVFSKESNRSPQVLREVSRAINEGAIVIPFRLDDIDMSRDLRFYLSTIHWFDATSQPVEKRISEVVQVVKAGMRTNVVSGSEIVARSHRKNKLLARLFEISKLLLVFFSGMAIGRFLLAPPTERAPTAYEIEAMQRKEQQDRTEQLRDEFVVSIEMLVKQKGENVTVSTVGDTLTVIGDRSVQKLVQQHIAQLCQTAAVQEIIPLSDELSEKELAIERALGSAARFDFFETAFSDVLAELSDIYAIQIQLDPFTTGLFEDSLVTIMIDTSLENALGKLLEPYLTTFAVSDDTIWIIDKDIASERFAKETTYDISNLLKSTQQPTQRP